MEEKQENSVIADEKERKTIGEIFSKFLILICAIVAVALIGLTVFALINANKNSDADADAPEVITTTTTTTTTTAASTTVSSTTDASVAGVKIKGKVYAKKEANILATASEDATVVGKLNYADTIDFVSVDDEGWCTVVYEGKVCYVHRNYLTTKNPAAATETTLPNGRKVVNLNQKHWTVVVVDKDRQIPEGFEPELTYVADSGCALDSRVAPYYEKMYADALADGVDLIPVSGYRSYSSQEANYQALVVEYVAQGCTQKDAEDAAATEILPAGCSEHNLGFAMDICSVEQSFKDTQQYRWLVENAYKYGFIERYPEGKQDITGVIAEPWHWRFIGPAYAKDMKTRGAETLEEYLQSYNAKY